MSKSAPIRGFFPGLMRWVLLGGVALLVLALLGILYGWKGYGVRSLSVGVVTPPSAPPAQIALVLETPTFTPTPEPTATETPTPVPPTPEPTTPTPSGTRVLPHPRSLATLAPTATSTATPWYRGGTLHNATPAEWQIATPENKMATAADWITRIYRPTWRTEEELLTLSSELVACIDEVATSDSSAWTDNSLTTGVVAPCIIQMMQ